MSGAEPVTPADAALAGYLQSVELAVADVYAQNGALLGESSQPVVSKFQTHHSTYATELAKLAGAAAVHGPNPSLAALLAARLQAATDEPAVLTFLFGLENQLASTYGFAATVATSPDVVRLIATILPSTSGRCAVLGTLAKLSTPLLFPNGPVESTVVGDGADVRLGFDPTLFPVA
jgi:hypothetical protein